MPDCRFVIIDWIKYLKIDPVFASVMLGFFIFHHKYNATRCSKAICRMYIYKKRAKNMETWKSLCHTAI